MKPKISLHLRAARAYRAIEVLADRALEGTGVTAFEAEILLAVRRHPRWAVSSLARELAMPRRCLSRNLGALSKRGLVEVERTSGARTEMRLTEAGAALLVMIAPAWKAVEARIASHLGRKKAARIRSGLKSLTDPRLGAGDVVEPLVGEFSGPSLSDYLAAAERGDEAALRAWKEEAASYDPVRRLNGRFVALPKDALG